MTDELVIGGQLGPYLIESVIGRGGMSVVYRAKHSRLGTSVALKVLAPELSSDDIFRERFLNEAQMAAGIDHPNVIPMHDMGMHENSLYIVMRYIPGGDLRALLATSGPLEAERALALLTPIALALDAAHAHGLVHRDVKPGNILIQRSTTGEIQHVYLSDFGIAKSSSSMSGLTRAGGLIGTVEYMAPEQIQARDVSGRTDVYALAGVFYECITGRTPFARELAAGAWPPVGPLEPVSSMRPELPLALDGVIAKALSTDPADRYATCEQFLHACGYVLEARTSSVGGLAGATVAETTPPGAETAAADSAAWPGGTGQGGESPPGHGADRSPSAGPPPGETGQGGAPPPGRGADRWPPVSPPPPSQPPGGRPAAPLGGKPGGGGIGARIAARWQYAALLAALVAAAVVVVLLTSSSSTKQGKPSSSALEAVPTNRVTGSGSATVRLNGTVANVTLTTTGLDYNEALTHALHIHGGKKGQCPPASAARQHNGHLSISTTDGINYYGPPVLALTTRGDTTPSSIVVFSRYPNGGTISYSRTITVPADVANDIRNNNAVIVVHGIDYDHSGIYSGVLERSELNKALPATATAPALCGPLVGAQKAALNPRERGRARVYTASLAANAAAQSVPLGGLFVCEPGGASAPATPTGRRASTQATAKSKATA